MAKFKVTRKIRFGQTDAAGITYYPRLVEMINDIVEDFFADVIGFSYKEMEDGGIALPVLELSIKYFKPAFYDDELTIETVISEIPKARIHFEYKTYNSEGVLLNEAKTSLVFINKATMKPCSAPNDFVEGLKKHF